MFFLGDCIELSAIQSDANIAHWGRGCGGRGGGVEELAPRTRDPNPKPHAPTTTQIARASTCSPVAGFRGGDGEMEATEVDESGIRHQGPWQRSMESMESISGQRREECDHGGRSTETLLESLDG